MAHAIDEKDDAELAAELGDLLLQVVFHANIAEERGAFRLREVIEHVSEKMIRRHPHVFGGDDAATSGEVLRNWEAIKAEERAAEGQGRRLDARQRPQGPAGRDGGLPAHDQGLARGLRLAGRGRSAREAGRGGARAAATQ